MLEVKPSLLRFWEKQFKQIAPKRAGLIHMAHFFDHHDLEKQVKEVYEADIFPLYDGQILEYGRLNQ